MIDNSPEFGWFKKLTYIALPLIANFFLLLFLFVSLDENKFADRPQNAIPITLFFLMYLSGMGMFIAYGMTGKGWYEYFGDDASTPLVALVIFSWPIFFMFKVPIAIIEWLGNGYSPTSLWERVFSGTVMSLENFVCDGTVFLKIFYIGIPFLVYIILYIAIIIIAFPVLWYFMSPMGMGTFGIAVCISAVNADGTDESPTERAVPSYRWGSFLNVYAVALPVVLCAICHIALEGPQWQAIFSLILHGIMFLIDAIQSVYRLFCSGDPLCGEYA